MTWYVIKHVPTGKIIPCANGRMDRGGSWVEPANPKDQLPKVFTEKRYAKAWLTTWLKGSVDQVPCRDWETGVVDYMRLSIVPQPHRKREEYKIVPISFRIGQ